MERTMSGSFIIPVLQPKIPLPVLPVLKDGLPMFLVADGKIMENEVATAKRKRVLSKPAKCFTLEMA